MKPGDCSVFGACVAKETEWDSAAPLSGQLVYDGILPMVHILTKDEERRKKKEEAKKAKHEQRALETSASKDLRAQQAKDKQALRKSKSKSKGDASSGSIEASDDRGSVEGSLDHSATSSHSHTAHSEGHATTPRSNDSKRASEGTRNRSNSTADGDEPKSGTKAGRRRSDKVSRTDKSVEKSLERTERSDKDHSDATASTTTTTNSRNISASAPSKPSSALAESADASDTSPQSSGGDTTEQAPTSRRVRNLPSVLSNMMKHPNEDDRTTESSAGSVPTTPRSGSVLTSPEKESAPLSTSSRGGSESAPGSMTLSHNDSYSVGTPRQQQSHQNSQLIVSWKVGEKEAEYEQRCTLLTVSWNELNEHVDGHAALLIEVQERIMPESQSEEVPVVAEEESAHHHHHHHHHHNKLHLHHFHRHQHGNQSEHAHNAHNAHRDDHEKEVEKDATAASEQPRHGVHKDPKFQPTRKVNRGVSAAYLRSTATLKKADLERLEQLTYFDQEEIRELHILFSKVSGYTSYITAETFNAFLPELSDPELRKAVFMAFDKSHEHDDRISFDEFVQSLSSMCRGTPEERARVVFDMCAQTRHFGQAYITRDQVLAIVSRIATAMEQAGFEPRDYGNPTQVVNNVFMKQGSSAAESAKPSVRGRITVFAKGIGHLRRDERSAARKYAKADYNERTDFDELDELDEPEDNASDSDDSSVGDIDSHSDGSYSSDSSDSSASGDEGAKTKDGTVAAAAAAASSSRKSGSRRLHRKSHRRDGAKTKHGSSLAASKDNVAKQDAKQRQSFFQRVSSRRLEARKQASFRVPRTDSSAIPPRPMGDINPIQRSVLAPSGHAIEAEKRSQLEKVAELSREIDKRAEEDGSDASHVSGHDNDSESYEAMMAESSTDDEFVEEQRQQPAKAEPIATKKKKTKSSENLHAGEEDEEDVAKPKKKSPRKHKDHEKAADDDVEGETEAISSATKTGESPREGKKTKAGSREIIEEGVAKDDVEKKRVAFAMSKDRIALPGEGSDSSLSVPASSPRGKRGSHLVDTDTPDSSAIDSQHHAHNDRDAENKSGNSTPQSPASPVHPRRSTAHHRLQTNHYETGLSRKQFKTRCKNESDLAECFGLFDFFNAAIVEPLIRLSAERNAMKLISIAGYMSKERGSMSRKIGKNRDKRFFVLKDGFLGYSKRPGGPLERAIPLFGASIKVNITEKKNAFTIIAPFFKRKLTVQTPEQAHLWVHAMRQMLAGGKKRFKSFAPPRHKICIRPFMNGKEYFDALVPVLAKVKRRLLISGWYLSPGLLLKRGAVDAALDRFRLDNMILDAANRGVSIYIIIYNAPSFTDFDLQPTYVCNYFNNLHPNIHALMHPNTYVPSMWSHHQKLVTCDETIGFIGGIDLCYGRYEDSDYSITDELETNFPGRDYCNVFLENESNGPSEQAVVDRKKQPRMPWSDVQVQLNGMAAYDVALNFMQRWDHIVREGTYECKPLPFIFPSHSVRDPEQAEGVIDASTGRVFPPEADGPQTFSSVTGASMERLMKSSTSKSKDTTKKEKEKEEKQKEELLTSEGDTEEEPNKLRRSAVERQREKEAKRTKGKRDEANERVDKYAKEGSDPAEPATVPETSEVEDEHLVDKRQAEDPENPTAAEALAVEEANASNSVLVVPEVNWDSRVPFENVSLADEELGCSDCTVQIVRSVCSWSAGTATPEQSIYKAYVDLIRNAEHTIFIQNQYFISSIDRPAPKNRLIEALYLRLRTAIEHRQDFRVLILVPVLPGGAHIEAASTRYMLKYTYRTISRGGHSLLEKLQKDFPDVDVHEYVRFGTPRQIGRLGDELISEPVYIHSKVMIVDDKRAIIGSANINDRSLRGTRDSEIACVIEPGESRSSPSRCTVQMNGRSYEACLPVHQLRVRMWADMIGVKVNSTKQDDLEQLELLKDPFSGLDLLMRRAEINTKAYLRLFPGMIPNVIYKISDFKRATASVGPEADAIVREQRLEDVAQIRGIITSWPFDFLKDEPIGIGFFEKEYMVPRIIFL